MYLGKKTFVRLTKLLKTKRICSGKPQRPQRALSWLLVDLETFLRCSAATILLVNQILQTPDF